jgi:YD repeat-containing protein
VTVVITAIDSNIVGKEQASNTTIYCPDGLGWLAKVIDPSGTTTQHAYDLLNDLTAVTMAGQT